jgi:hypothetical protein
MGDLELFRDNYRAATDAFQESIEVADAMGDAQLQGNARRGAVLASILGGDLISARRLVEAVRQDHYPLADMQNSALFGVVLHRQRDLDVARQAFAAAVDQADALLTMAPERYTALDTKAIALCGLVLCGSSEKAIAARVTFRAARAITSAVGVVHKVLQLFDTLALGDKSGFLAEIRPIAAGEET